jgi:hypothetical protein
MSQPRNFWSRRMADVKAEEKAELAAKEAEAIAQEMAVQEQKQDDELLAELKLPDPDTMKMGDDFSAFLSKAVPERLRRRALRKLWLSNPVLANLDGLIDYGEDYTDAATVVENMQTSYQVGKGLTKHVIEMARQKAEEESAIALGGDDVVPLALEEADEFDISAQIDEPEYSEDGNETLTESAVSDETVSTQSRPRMRFGFASG